MHTCQYGINTAKRWNTIVLQAVMEFMKGVGMSTHKSLSLIFVDCALFGTSTISPLHSTIVLILHLSVRVCVCVCVVAGGHQNPTNPGAKSSVSLQTLSDTTSRGSSLVSRPFEGEEEKGPGKG